MTKLNKKKEAYDSELTIPVLQISGCVAHAHKNTPKQTSAVGHLSTTEVEIIDSCVSGSREQRAPGTKTHTGLHEGESKFNPDRIVRL